MLFQVTVLEVFIFVIVQLIRSSAERFGLTGIISGDMLQSTLTVGWFELATMPAISAVIALFKCCFMILFQRHIDEDMPVK